MKQPVFTYFRTIAVFTYFSTIAFNMHILLSASKVDISDLILNNCNIKFRLLITSVSYFRFHIIYLKLLFSTRIKQINVIIEMSLCT